MAAVTQDEGRHIRGVSLASKLAVAIGLSIAAFMVAFGLFLYKFVQAGVRDGLRVTAREAARAAAQTDYEAWDVWFGTEFQGTDEFERERLAQEMREREYARRFQGEEITRTTDWNRARLRRALETDGTLIAADVRPIDDPRRLLLASFEGTVDFGGLVGTREEFDDGGGVEEGFLTIGGNRRHVIKGWHPISDAEGVPRAIYSGYIDAREIDESTAELMQGVMFSALVFIVVGAGVAVLIGRRVAKPLAFLKEDIRIVAGGELDHHTTPHSNDEIGELARTFDRMTRSLADARKAERAQQRAQHQLSVAGEVTERLFPEVMPTIAGYEVAGHHERAAQLSGEYYDVVPMPAGRLGFMVASASGTGVPAAMVMAMARSTFIAVARHESEPAAILREINALMARDLRHGMYVSAMMAVLDPGSGVLELANAGHSPLLHYHAADERLAAVQSEGIALGFDTGPVFDRTLKPARVELAPGDRAVMYTPTLSMMTGADTSVLGDKRLAGVVRKQAAHAPGDLNARVAATLAKFRGSEAVDVDVTLLTIGRDA